MWPPLFGASLLPFPLLLTHLCSVFLRQSPALQHHAGKLLVFRAPCPQHHPLYPVYPLSCCVSGSLPPHPGDSRSQQFPAYPFAVQSPVVSPPDSGILGISPPQPQGCAPALSGAAITVLQPYLAQPYLCSVRCHENRSLCPSSSLWPCCPPGAWLRVNPVLGVPAVGGELPTGSIPWELHRRGSQSQEKIFWAFSRPILMPRMGGLQQ